MYSPRGRKGGGVNEWYLQRVSAVVLLLAVVFHFLYMHLVTSTNPQDLNFDKVGGRLSNPVWLVFDFILLTGAVVHGVIGLKLSLDDYIKSPFWRLKAVSLVYLLMGTLWLLGSVALLKVGMRYNGAPAAVQAGDSEVYDAGAGALDEPANVDGATDPPPQETPDWYPKEGGEE